MLAFLPNFIKAVLSTTILVFNTILVCSVIFVFGLIKFVVPIKWVKNKLSLLAASLAEIWSDLNSFTEWLTQDIEWQVDDVEGLSKDKTYLVIANHQSWVDIYVLTKVLNRKIPFLRFFLKQELMWVPFLNLAWWSLDFPFLKRYSREYLKKHPHKMGKDIETARKSCEKFKEIPASILIFAEGTRFSEHKKEGDLYKHLLPPKAGGLSTSFDVMGEQFDAIIDVTIVYPNGHCKISDLIRGRLNKVVVKLKKYEVPAGFFVKEGEKRRGAYLEKKKWLKSVWQEKDRVIGHVLESENPENSTEVTSARRPLTVL